VQLQGLSLETGFPQLERAKEDQVWASLCLQVSYRNMSS
jgi:hypothetical protein